MVLQEVLENLEMDGNRLGLVIATTSTLILGAVVFGILRSRRKTSDNKQALPGIKKIRHSSGKGQSPLT